MSDFPQATLETWHTRVSGVEKLASRMADGARIEPLYQQIQGPRADKNVYGPWQVLQRVDHPVAVKANAQVMDDLENGAVGLSIARSFDPMVIEGVALHAIHIMLEHGDDSAKAFAKYVDRQPIDPSRLQVSFGLKDMGLIKRLIAQGFVGPFMDADGRAFHNQGATETQELACVLAGLVRILRGSGNIMPSATLAANQDMFLTLAKFRAIRILWARILEVSSLPFVPLQLHGETSLRMMASLDPHMNLLRATTAVFGAGLGGCDSFTVLPFSIKQGVPNAFARRMARNTQLVMQEEAQLWRVADAASGSGYIESLTHDFCEKAWEVFQGIERTGREPEFDANNTSSDPLIGSSTHQLRQEFAAAVDTLS